MVPRWLALVLVALATFACHDKGANPIDASRDDTRNDAPSPLTIDIAVTGCASYDPATATCRGSGSAHAVVHAGRLAGADAVQVVLRRRNAGDDRARAHPHVRPSGHLRGDAHGRLRPARLDHAAPPARGDRRPAAARVRLRRRRSMRQRARLPVRAWKRLLTGVRSRRLLDDLRKWRLRRKRRVRDPPHRPAVGCGRAHAALHRIVRRRPGRLRAGPRLSNVARTARRRPRPAGRADVSPWERPSIWAEPAATPTARSPTLLARPASARTSARSASAAPPATVVTRAPPRPPAPCSPTDAASAC